MRRLIDKILLVIRSVLVRIEQLEDWVLDLQLIRSNAQGAMGSGGIEQEWGRLAVGYAHNVVEVLEWGSGGGGWWRSINRVCCCKNPLLMCMSLYGDDVEGGLWVAGAGFTKEVLVWSVGGADAGGGKRDVVSLVGHNGVVHCVSWGGDGGILASASEDRTVRVWRRGDGDEWAHSAVLGGGGVGGHGHQARIWGCDIMDGWVVTASEDGASRVYMQPKGGEEAWECVGVLTGHQGKHVWTCMLVRDGNGGKKGAGDVLAVTGGNDSAVKVWARTGEGSGAGSEWLVCGEDWGSGVCGGGGGGNVVVHEQPKWEDSSSSSVEDLETAAVECGVGEGGGGKRPKREAEVVRCCALMPGGGGVLSGTNMGRVCVR